MLDHALLSDPSLPVVDRAEGVFIYDTTGKQYLDACGGAMTVSIGHGVPEVIDAMVVQARAVSFVYRTQFANEPARQLAQELAEIAPGDINHAFFVNSGSEATELAMRAALQYWRERGRPGKCRVLGRQISYHGMTMGALSMSGHGARRADYGDLLTEVAAAPPPYPYRFALQGADAEDHGAAVWDRILREEDTSTVAAIIVEPIVGAAGGALTPPVGYLAALRKTCDQHDVLLIADEVITGLGRTGHWFACEHDDVVPDLIACGKGLSSGYTPIGALLYRDKLVEAMSGAPFGHTFSNNPLSAATSLAVLRYMRRIDVLANVAARGRQLETGLRSLALRHSFVADIRGRGLLWGFEFVTDRLSKTVPRASDLTNSRFVAQCFQAGLIVYPAGIAPLNNAVLLAPPLTSTEAEIEILLNRLDAALVSFNLEPARSGNCLAK